MLINILLFLVVLGVLIFFHELGHFAAAKACNVYVDRFSLGMPPRVAGFRYGETDYCIGALPIGGYVKMAGQEDAPRSEEEQTEDYGHVPRERWFSTKPPWQRAIVLLAGPLMNLVLGIGIYGFMVGFGAEVPEHQVDSRIGYIEEGSVASTAPLYAVDEGGVDFSGEPSAVGWRTGDRILTMDGERVENIRDVAIGAILSGGNEIEFEIERMDESGEWRRYRSRVAPALVHEDEEYPRFGVMPYQAAYVAEVFEGLPAERAGLEANDVILRANGEPVDRNTFMAMLEEGEPGQPVDLEVERGGEVIETVIEPEIVGRIIGVRTHPNLTLDPDADPEATPRVLDVARIHAETNGLLERDEIVEIDGEPATAQRLADIQRERAGETVAFTVRRPPVWFGLLRAETFETVNVEIEPVNHIGVAFGQRTVFHRVPPAQIVPEAFRQGTQALMRVVHTVRLLVTQDVSMRELGGPVMIYNVTTDAAQMGWYPLFEIVAFISINLCVFNLLPLPVLDGGQLVFVAVEAIRRKPVSPKVWERTQMIGVMLILMLLVFVTYNDILRVISNALPG